MLDLTLMNRTDYYELRLIDGTELHLRRPTQAMVQYSLVLQELAQNNKQIDTMEAISKLFSRILNRNIEGKKYEALELAQSYDFDVIAYVISDYFKYWNKEITQNVNFLQDQQN